MVNMERIVLVALLAATVVGFCSPGAIALGDNPSVIIVGAGMSGISAAKSLSDAGITDILILEATNRIGGRMHKTSFAGLSVELGANWVEGVGGDEDNPIWEMVNKLELDTFYSNFDNLSANIYKQEGGLYNADVVQEALELAENVEEISENISNALIAHGENDISVLTSQRLADHVPTSPLDMVLDYYTYDYEFAEPPRVTSLQNTAPLPTFANFGEDIYFVGDSKGYESVVHHIAKQFLTTDDNGNITDLRVKLNKVVTEINYKADGVVVTTEDGSTYEADYVMVSVSIGVLQTKLINFVPILPPWKILALYKLDMGVYTKIFLKFPYKFWPTGNGTEFFLYASERRGYFAPWQHLENEYPGSNVLLVTATDDESRRIEQQSDSETKAEIMKVLRKMFGNHIPDATDILVPKWWSNRFYKGSFSNWPIGVSRLDYEEIRAPVGRVYFTGEHTSEHYNGYVHGAYLAGIDSANMMISSVNKQKVPNQEHRDFI
ncbi:hypothetical protein HHK36_029632 [Tetracentron sinense]|uniref:Amine oxidase domain-containing protein n=1 Tax=Tetracentron sinense TaxID=13715 RepID=A0A834Y9V1_TETSI|nr:hypothetical protein HHK36_029632 [Tetracentron sinense]